MDQHAREGTTDTRQDAAPVTFAVLKALSSKARFRILQALTERRMTVTELGKELEMEKGTVHSHMGTLLEADLVERHEDDRLWVYYSLTGLGSQIAAADRPRLILLVGSSIISLSIGGLLLVYFRLLRQARVPPGGDDDILPPDGPDLPLFPDIAPEEAWIVLIAALLLIVVAILFASLAIHKLFARLSDQPTPSAQE